ncbi:MAG TPA: hypothetical protein VHE37_06920, partial [Nevskiaceae bacterium]|nr:hypothetical protein [Nevskiaceae bacterium]
MAAEQPDAGTQKRKPALSAEAIVAVGLLSVCAIVGGAWWLLQLRAESAPADTAGSGAADAATDQVEVTASSGGSSMHWQSALQG